MAPTGEVRVAAVQCSSRMGSPAAVAANAEKMGRLARDAAAGGARIVVFPEAALTGYCSQAFLHTFHVEGRRLRNGLAGVDPEGIAQRVGASPLLQGLVDLAGELGIYLSIPFVEEADCEDGAAPGGKRLVYHNTVLLATPKGEVGAHYRKTHLWDHIDGCWCTAGNAPGIVDTEFGRLGLGICYDVHSLDELYAGRGLWLLLYSVAWYGDAVFGPTERWFRQDLAERYLSQWSLKCYVVAANWSTDQAQAWDGAGYSSIYDPAGQRLANVSGHVGDSILYHDIPTADGAVAGTVGASEAVATQPSPERRECRVF